MTAGSSSSAHRRNGSATAFESSPEQPSARAVAVFRRPCRHPGNTSCTAVSASARQAQLNGDADVLRADTGTGREPGKADRRSPGDSERGGRPVHELRTHPRSRQQHRPRVRPIPGPPNAASTRISSADSTDISTATGAFGNPVRSDHRYRMSRRDPCCPSPDGGPSRAPPPGSHRTLGSNRLSDSDIREDPCVEGIRTFPGVSTRLGRNRSRPTATQGRDDGSGARSGRPSMGDRDAFMRRIDVRSGEMRWRQPERPSATS